MSPARTTIGLWLALLCACGLLLPFLGSGGFAHEEPRRVVIAQEMLQDGRFLVPHLLGEVYTAKPPLYNWLLLPAGLDGEITPMEARAVSWLALALLALACVHLTRDLLTVRQRLFVGIGTVLAVESMRKATLAEIDMTFAALVAIALLTWMRAHLLGRRGLRLWLGPMLLMALAYLTKREPAVVFFYLPVLVVLGREGRLRELFQPGHLIAGLLATAVAASWLLPVILARGLPGFIADTRTEVTERGLHATPLSILGNAASYPFEVWLAAAPFALLLPLLLLAELRRTDAGSHPLAARVLAFALLAVAVNLPLYMFRGSVSVRYFLPMLPFLVIAASFPFEAFVQGAQPRLARSLATALAGLCMLVALLLLGLALQQLGLWQGLTETPPALLLPPALALALIALLAAATGLAWTWRSTAPALALAGLLTAVSAHYQLAEWMVLQPRQLARADAATELQALRGALRRLPEDDAVGIVGAPPRLLWSRLPIGALPYETDSPSQGQRFWLGSPQRLAERFGSGTVVARARVLGEPIELWTGVGAETVRPADRSRAVPPATHRSPHG